jgi:hypothetical protein
MQGVSNPLPVGDKKENSNRKAKNKNEMKARAILPFHVKHDA